MQCFGMKAGFFPSIETMKEINEIRVCLSSAGVMTDVIEQDLQDLSYFAVNRQLRRKDVYFSRL